MDFIPLSEFAARRRKLRAALKDSVGLVFAGDHDAHSPAPFRPHAHFEYLTGVMEEPGAVLLLDPRHPVEARREQLFLKALNPELERWDGYRETISSGLRERTGFATIFRTDALPRFLSESVRRNRKLACLHELAVHTQPVSPDLAVFQQAAQRVPGTTIIDRTETIASMRAVKSSAEIAMIRRAIEITAIGFATMMAGVRPGMNEFDVQELIEHTYRSNGARSLSFGTIAGSGLNSTVLHYRANNRTIEAGDLVCVDSGVAWQGYSADVTRTVPASGRFTARQREVYDIVLAANLAGIKAVRTGRSLAQIDAAARAVIIRAGFGDAFIHGTGHHLGIQTHDITPDAPLRAGAVITIEPGIYLPDERIGIRIEDDVLVTTKGATVLTSAIPKTAAAIETAMGGTRSRVQRTRRR
jgi:Xaa-Pro aminopeptidase